jgi:3-oxoacyl-[acyl-carrier protein] reductase
MVGACLSLASELAPDNIRVNVMLPGLMAGPMLDGLSPGERARRLSRALLGRANDPAEVARFAVFLATTHCVTGQVFAMDSRPLPWA